MFQKLQVIIEANIKGFKKGTEQAKAEVNKLKNEVDKKLSTIGEDVGGLKGLRKSLKDAYAPLFAPLKKINSLVVRPKIETDQFRRSRERAEDLREAILKLQSTRAKIPAQIQAPEYEETIQELELYKNASEGARNSLRKLQEEYNKAGPSGKEKLAEPLRLAQNAADALDRKLGSINAKLEAMPNGGYVDNPQIANIEKQIARKTAALASEERKQSKMLMEDKAYEKTVTVFGRLKKSLDNLIKSFRKGTKANGDMSRGMRSTLGASGALSRMFRTLAISARFMIASMIFRGALDAIKQGFTDLAAYSEQTKSSLTMLKSSLIQLRGAFASAFAPILTAVAPVLNYLIQLLADAMTAVAKFFAYLTGQKTVTVAIPATREFKATGDEADKANDKAKELQKTLMGFDQINKLNDTTSASSTSTNGLDEGSVFQTIDTGANDFAQMVKDAWSTGDFFDVGYTVADKIADALEKIPWDRIKETAYKIGKSIATFINGACSNLRLWEDIGNTIAQGLNTAINFAYAFVKFLDVHAIAEAIATGINAALTNIEYDKLAYSIVTFISKAITLVVEILANLDYIAIGKAIIDGIGKGIKDALKDDPSNILGLAVLGALLTSKIGKLVGKIKKLLFGATKGAELEAPELASGWGGLVPKIKGILEKARTAVVAYGPAIGKSLTGTASTIGNALMSAIPVVGIAGLCATAVAAVVGMVEHWGESVQELKKNDPSEYFQTYGQSLHEMSGYADTGISGFAATISKYFGKDGKISKWMRETSADTSNNAAFMKQSWDGVAPKITSALSSIEQKAKDVPRSMQEMSGNTGSVLDNIKNAWADASTKIQSAIATIKEKISSTNLNANGAVSIGVSLVKKGWSSISSWVGSHVNVGVSLIRRGWSSLSSWVGTKVSVGISLLKKGWSSLKSWLGLDKVFQVKLRLPHIKVNWGTKSFGGVSISYPTGFSTYAKGGFPEEGPFYMNRGEIAGKFSNGKGVVANNQQITSGIAQAVGPAVYEAMVAALSSSGSNGNVTVVLEGDAKSLFKAVQREANNYTRSTGQLAFNV